MRQSSNDDRRHGGRRLAPAAHILARLFGGIVDDLKWRLERTTLQDNMLMRRAMMLGATTIALSALWGSAATTARFDPCRAAQATGDAVVPRVASCLGARGRRSRIDAMTGAAGIDALKVDCPTLLQRREVQCWLTFHKPFPRFR